MVDLVNKLIDSMIEKRKARLSTKIQRYPRQRFIASDIHDCDRYMVYSILDWDKRPLHDDGLQAIFDAGNKEEQNLKIRIQEDGFQIIQQQTPFEIKNKQGEVICSGKIDGKILFEKVAIPWEAKSMDANLFRGITSLDDFQKKSHLRKYIRQMQLYLFGNNAEAGLFTLSDFRREKHIPIALDYGICEHLLQRLERNWECVKKKEYPDRIEGHTDLCERCPFAHICLPEVKHDGAKIIDNAELESQLDRRFELQDLSKEYEALDEEIKEAFKGIPLAFVGTKYQITGKAQQGIRVDTKALPDDIREKYAIKTDKWVIKIIKI